MQEDSTYRTSTMFLERSVPPPSHGHRPKPLCSGRLERQHRRVVPVLHRVMEEEAERHVERLGIRAFMSVQHHLTDVGVTV